MKSKKGFGGMTAKKRHEVAVKGGKKAQELGVAHQWTPEEARVAGAAGGKKKRKK